MISQLDASNKKLEEGDPKRLVIFSIIQSIRAVTNTEGHHAANLLNSSLMEEKKEWIERWISRIMPDFDFTDGPSKKGKE